LTAAIAAAEILSRHRRHKLAFGICISTVDWRLIADDYLVRFSAHASTQADA
jgi:hypothetical protein